MGKICNRCDFPLQLGSMNEYMTKRSVVQPCRSEYWARSESRDLNPTNIARYSVTTLHKNLPTCSQTKHDSKATISVGWRSFN